MNFQPNFAHAGNGKSNRHPAQPNLRHAHTHANLFSKVNRVIKNLPLMYSIQNERRQLAKLTDKELKDIGIDRVDALRESARKFHDIPVERVSRGK